MVTSVGPDAILGTENGQPLRLTPELNPRESPLVTQSGTELLRFPLQVGQQWRNVMQVRFKDNGSTARVETLVRVAAHEKVRVAAGEFDAFRLEAKGTIDGNSYGGSGQLRGETATTYWYAPAARAIVKSTNRNTCRGESTVELVSYRLQPRDGAGPRLLATRARGRAPRPCCPRGGAPRCRRVAGARQRRDAAAARAGCVGRRRPGQPRAVAPRGP